MTDLPRGAVVEAFAEQRTVLLEALAALVQAVAPYPEHPNTTRAPDAGDVERARAVLRRHGRQI